MLDGITLLDTGTKVVSYTWAGVGADLSQQYLRYFLLLYLFYVRLMALEEKYFLLLEYLLECSVYLFLLMPNQVKQLILIVL